MRNRILDVTVFAILLALASSADAQTFSSFSAGSSSTTTTTTTQQTVTPQIVQQMVVPPQVNFLATPSYGGCGFGTNFMGYGSGFGFNRGFGHRFIGFNSFAASPGFGSFATPGFGGATIVNQSFRRGLFGRVRSANQQVISSGGGGVVANQSFGRRR